MVSIVSQVSFELQAETWGVSLYKCCFILNVTANNVRIEQL